MKTREQFRDWLHGWMVKLEPLSDDSKPDEETCQKIARVAGKMAARHGLGGEPYRQAEEVQRPEDTLALLADCLQALGTGTGNTEPAGNGLLTIAEAAQRTSLSAATIRQACPDGLLRSSRFGRGRGTYRIAPEDLDQFVRDQQVVGTTRHLRHL